MEYRIKDYTIKGNRILLPKQTSIEDLRLIFNETQKKLICSTATKDNVTLVQGEGGTLVEVPASVCSLNSTDLLTIKCDYGDNLDEVKEAVENIDLTSIESKVEAESQAIQSAIHNIDLSSIENKVEEVKQAVEDIDLTPIENKVQEGVDALSSKIDNIDLSAVENKVQEESAAIQAKIDNIKFPEIDTSAIAKEITLQEVSTKVTNLEALITESVLQEVVTIILNCQESIVWQDYAVNVTFEDGRTQAVPLSENGTCSFNIKIGQNYSVQLPVIGTFIAPTLKTYTAITTAKEIYWSYVVSGVFGMDELGRRYSIEQIEALADKNIIKYGGFTTDYLENSHRDDGGSGNGFMWELDNSKSLTRLAWASENIEFSQELLPFLTSDSMARPYCNGKAYTEYIISEGIRLGVTTPAATWCNNNVINVKKQSIHGYLPAFGQIIRLTDNYTAFNLLYQTLGLETPPFLSINYAMATSCQSSAASIVRCDTGKYLTGLGKTFTSYRIFCIFDLPK